MISERDLEILQQMESNLKGAADLLNYIKLDAEDKVPYYEDMYCFYGLNTRKRELEFIDKLLENIKRRLYELPREIEALKVKIELANQYEERKRK